MGCFLLTALARHAGRLAFSTADNKLYFDNGSEWVQVGALNYLRIDGTLSAAADTERSMANTSWYTLKNIRVDSISSTVGDYVVLKLETRIGGSAAGESYYFRILRDTDVLYTERITYTSYQLREFLIYIPSTPAELKYQVQADYNYSVYVRNYRVYEIPNTTINTIIVID